MSSSLLPARARMKSAPKADKGEALFAVRQCWNGVAFSSVAAFLALTENCLLNRYSEHKSTDKIRRRPWSHPVALYMALILTVGACRCGNTISLDLSFPEGPVEGLFAAAAAGDADTFRRLCSSRSEDCGLESGNLCAVRSNSESWDGVQVNYGSCKVAGKAVVSGDQALIPVRCSPSGQPERSGLMGAIQRGGHWFLAPRVWYDHADPEGVFEGGC